jgi:hypothetical protein
MNHLRNPIGIVGGVLLILSSAAHSLLGWKQLGAALATAGAPVELVTGLSIGWHFAGVAMFVFGCIVISIFVDAMRKRPVSFRPVALIAAAYLLFGVWALGASGLDPLFLVFILPGILLAAASWRPGVVSSAARTD